MSRSDREGRLPCEGAGLPPCGKTEGVLQIGKIRMRFALRCTCLRCALSVICFANASSPKGRAEKPERTAHMPHQAISCAYLLACCSFRHGLRRATFLREKGFGFTRRPNLSLPLGEMSRSDREGRLPYEGAGLPPCGKTEGVCQIGKIRIRSTLRCTCSRVCPLSHLLRKCQLSQRESREAGATERAFLLKRRFFPIKKHSAECFFMYPVSWTMCCRMLEQL